MKKRTIGNFYEIQLENNLKTIARLVDKVIFLFYNTFKPTDHVFTEEDLLEQLFYLPVHIDVFQKSSWCFVDLVSTENLPQKKDLIFFKQDIFDSKKCWLVDASGRETKVDPQQCLGYDRLAAWEFMGVEKRLIDFYYGRPSSMLEVLKLKL